MPGTDHSCMKASVGGRVFRIQIKDICFYHYREIGVTPPELPNRIK